MEVDVRDRLQRHWRRRAFDQQLVVETFAAGIEHAVEIDHVADLQIAEILDLDRHLQPDFFQTAACAVSVVDHSTVSLRI